MEADPARLAIDRIDSFVNDIDRNIGGMWSDRVLNFR